MIKLGLATATAATKRTHFLALLACVREQHSTAQHRQPTCEHTRAHAHNCQARALSTLASECTIQNKFPATPLFVLVRANCVPFRQ